ncbi:EGF-like domain protein, partial [Cooperia oncophora]
MCINHSCANNATCVNGPNKTYKCECQKNTVGTYCQFACEPNQCSGNGTCIMRIDGRVGCKCDPGITGLRCEREIDECRRSMCQNSLKCIDKFNDYECVCMDGWIGKNCDRPCQDIYGSCKMWKREGQCEIPPEETAFFVLNCPESCENYVISSAATNIITVGMDFGRMAHKSGR